MKSTHVWSYKLKDAQGAPLPIYNVIYTTDGSKVVVAAGSELLVYDAVDGTVMKSIKAHKQSILCLTPLIHEGFASGGKDKQVMIWSSSYKGTFKYSHNDPVESISQNPVTGVVLTCTATDFGLWTTDRQAVPKTKVILDFDPDPL
jgi:intraflagellar transport protein 122